MIQLDIKTYIIEEADKLFYQFGFKSVTMDDIAKHLHMSKKTIYQHFIDKDDLVSTLIKEKILTQNCLINEGSKNANDAIHEIFFAITNMNTVLANMNPKLLYDLQKYHPKAWKEFKTFKENNLRETITYNLKRGIAEGIYRKEINIEILTQMRLQQIDILFNDASHFSMNKYSLIQVMTEITEHFLYGICNSKGLELIHFYK